MKPKFKKWLKCVAVPLVVGAVAGFLSSGGMKDFAALNQPPLSPPGWLFPVVWTILYILMGTSYCLVLSADPAPQEKQKATSIYFYQLIANFLWPVFFFNFQWYLFSFFWLLLLEALIIIMILRFYPISRLASWLCIPYALWVAFAGYLNLGIWLLNR